MSTSVEIKKQAGEQVEDFHLTPRQRETIAAKTWKRGRPAPAVLGALFSASEEVVSTWQATHLHALTVSERELEAKAQRIGKLAGQLRDEIESTPDEIASFIDGAMMTSSDTGPGASLAELLSRLAAAADHIDQGHPLKTAPSNEAIRPLLRQLARAWRAHIGEPPTGSDSRFATFCGALIRGVLGHGFSNNLIPRAVADSRN